MPGSDSMTTSSPQTRSPCSARLSEVELRRPKLGEAVVAVMGQLGRAWWPSEKWKSSGLEGVGIGYAARNERTRQGFSREDNFLSATNKSLRCRSVPRYFLRAYPTSPTSPSIYRYPTIYAKSATTWDYEISSVYLNAIVESTAKQGVRLAPPRAQTKLIRPHWHVSLWDQPQISS